LHLRKIGEPSSREQLIAIRQCRIVQEVIAEIISLSGYESQVSALMDEEERAAMEFFIACGPEDHPVIAGSGGFRKARWARRAAGDRNVLAKLAGQIKKALKGDRSA
jgi:hypothetical protein